MKKPNTQNLHSFLPITCVWNQHKILCLAVPNIDLVERILQSLALFAIFECICLKNCSFSDILQKVKLYCFANRFVLRLNLIEIYKEFKIEVSLVCII